MRSIDLLLLVIALCASACVPPAGVAVHRTVRARLNDRAIAEDEIGADRADVRGLLAQPLGPEDAARIALLHNPDAAAAIDELGVASANLLAESLPPNPDFDSETRLGRSGAGDELEAHVVVDVTALITLPLRRAAAEAELEAAQLRAAHEVLDLAYETRAAFIRFQAAMERRALAQTTVEAARATLELARALHEAGNVPALNVVVPEGLYEESRLALSRADLEVLDLREELHVLMGLSGNETAWHAQEQLAELPTDEQDLDALEGRAIERSLLLAEAEQRLVALARRHGVARVSGLVPDLHAGVSASVADQIFAVGPALSITLPLFDQGIADADRIEAHVNVERRRYLAAAIEVRSMVRRARNRLLAAREQERFIRETLLPVRHHAVQETLLQYNAMAASPFQLLDARRDEIEAGRALVDARRDYWLAHVALERILAGGSARLEPLGAAREMGARSQGGH